MRRRKPFRSRLQRKVDLGLALLSRRLIYGNPLSLDDIAAWCGCDKSYIHRIEKTALRKIQTQLVNERQKFQ